MSDGENAEGIGRLVLAALTASGKAAAGVPAAMIANTVRVVGRLAGSASSIPVAWLDSKSQKIRDEAAARSTIVKALAKAAAKEATGDPDFVQGALETFAGDLVRRESNKRMVAHAAIEEVAHQASASNEAAPTESAGEIDEDWINVFSQYAENASTERMQRLWGRVAAGEARQPGTYSLATLRVVSELDKQTAENIAEMSKYFVGDIVLPTPDFRRGTLFTLTMKLRGSGLLLGREGDASRYVEIDETGSGAMVFRGLANGPGYAIQIHGTPKTSRTIPVILLSTQAIELSQLLPAADPWPHLKAAALAMDKSGLTAIDCLLLNAENVIVNTERVWSVPPVS